MRKKVSEIDYIKLYKEVFETPSGQLVLFDICKKFHIDSTIRKPTDTMREDMILREGQRQVALHLLQMVNYDMDAYYKRKELNQLEVQHDR